MELIDLMLKEVRIYLWENTRMKLSNDEVRKVKREFVDNGIQFDFKSIHDTAIDIHCIKKIDGEHGKMTVNICEMVA